MADPTNPNEPEYANDPHYVYVGGRWQYRSHENTPEELAQAKKDSKVITVDSLTPDAVKNTVADNLRKGIGAPGIQKTVDSFYNAALGAQSRNPIAQSTMNADQSRAGLLDAYNMMLQRSRGQSLAGLQGSAAMDQGLQTAAQAQAAGQGGAAFRAASPALGGLAGQTAVAAARENLANQQGLFGVASGTRAGDIQQAQQVGQVNAASKALKDKLTAKLLSQGYSLADALRGADIAIVQLSGLAGLNERKTESDNTKAVAGAVGSVASLAGRG